MSAVFAVGDLVTYEGKIAGKIIQCKIVKIMPLENAHAVRSYRIRGNTEAFERAVPEFTLTRIEPTATDLIFKS
jgi:hypothetical protein